MKTMIRPSGFGVVCLALLACACGDDGKTTPQPAPVDNEGGAPAVQAFPPAFPPALGPEDCATTTSEITLSQPDGAAVWGGLVLLEFEVEGAKVDAFDVQVYDPSLGAWLNGYVNQGAYGQRDDGSYFMAVSPTYNDANKDQELKVRVRPQQPGCPEADWTETDTFTAGNPLEGTSWHAQLPGALFSGMYMLQRFDIVTGAYKPGLGLRIVDASLTMTFGKKGALSEALTLSLATEADAPFDGCTLSLAFEGTYDLLLRQQYGGMTLAISDQVLTSAEGTTCELPAVEDMALSGEDFEGRINAYTQGVSINYLPTLYLEPGIASWTNNNFGQIFQQLPELFAYTTADELGTVSGYVYPIELTLEQQP